MYERFVKQLDGCSYVSGGLNCGPASLAMWLYRASQGKVATTACAIRKLTGDTSGGTNLTQLEAVARNHFGITGGTIYRPIKFSDLHALLRSGRYAAIVQIGYKPIRGTSHDCFRGNFSGGHAELWDAATATTIRVGDPGADGRYTGCPKGFQNYPLALAQQATNALPLTPNLTLAQDMGPGFVWAYVTPKDPAAYRYTTTGVWLHTQANAQTATRRELMPDDTKLQVLSKVTGGSYYVGSQRHTDWLRVKRMSNGHIGYTAAYYTHA